MPKLPAPQILSIPGAGLYGDWHCPQVLGSLNGCKWQLDCAVCHVQKVLPEVECPHMLTVKAVLKAGFLVGHQMLAFICWQSCACSRAEPHVISEQAMNSIMSTTFSCVIAYVNGVGSQAHSNSGESQTDLTCLLVQRMWQ